MAAKVAGSCGNTGAQALNAHRMTAKRKITFIEATMYKKINAAKEEFYLASFGKTSITNNSNFKAHHIMSNDQTPQIQDLLNKYKYSLLSSKNELHPLKNKIKNILPEDKSDDFFKEADQWIKNCISLGIEAKKIYRNNFKKGHPEFDALFQKAKELDPIAEDYINRILDKGHWNPDSPKNDNTENLSEKLSELRKYASWNDHEIKVDKLSNNILFRYPDQKERVETEIRLGKLAKEYYDSAYKLGLNNGSQADIARMMVKMKHNGLNESEIKKAEKQYRNGASARKRQEDAKAYPLDKLDWSNLESNSINSLKPAKKWTILFDETGKEFTRTAPSKRSSIGKGVFLIVPDYVKLPDLERNWHASERTYEEIVKVIRQIKKVPCAVLGIPVTALPEIDRNKWLSCVEILLDLLLRLLPVEENTEINLLVEQKGEYNQTNYLTLDETCTASLILLARSNKEKANKIKIAGKFVTKNEHPWNGYVDAAAFIWGSPKHKDLLHYTQWEDLCLQNGKNIKRLCAALDYFFLNHSLKPNDWNDLITDAINQKELSLSWTLLNKLGEKTSQNITLWEQYLNYTVEHLNSKAINMRTLGVKTSWLEQWRPDNRALPPRLRLLWLTTKLAEENHCGKIDSFPEYQAELKSLMTQLHDEDAPLTCDAALHLAVSHTDMFDFEGAKKLLEPWHDVKPAVPGLKLYGRLLSSHAQHEAFTDNTQAAINYFTSAFHAFGQLSDNKSAKLDIDQTCAYLLTVLMDSDQDIRSAFNIFSSKYFDGSPDDIAPYLATSIEDEEKYKHYILLRFLVSQHASRKEVNAYFSMKDKWRVGFGHPWELIEFYRACLCDDREEKLKRLNSAYEIAMTGSGPMHVIAAVIAGARLLLEPDGRDEYLSLVEQCRAEIPLLGARADILLEHPEKQYPPLILAEKVLPFNFR